MLKSLETDRKKNRIHIWKACTRIWQLHNSISDRAEKKKKSNRNVSSSKVTFGIWYGNANILQTWHKTWHDLFFCGCIDVYWWYLSVFGHFLWLVFWDANNLRLRDSDEKKYQFNIYKAEWNFFSLARYNSANLMKKRRYFNILSMCAAVCPDGFGWFQLRLCADFVCALSSTSRSHSLLCSSSLMLCLWTFWVSLFHAVYRHSKYSIFSTE